MSLISMSDYGEKSISMAETDLWREAKRYPVLSAKLNL